MYDKFTGEIFDARVKEEILVDKPNISGFRNNSDLNKKIATLATKAELTEG